MFEKMFEIEKRLEELNKFLQCGIYKIVQNNEIIFVADKIKILKNALKTEENRIKKLYF